MGTQACTLTKGRCRTLAVITLVAQKVVMDAFMFVAEPYTSERS